MKTKVGKEEYIFLLQIYDAGVERRRKICGFFFLFFQESLLDAGESKQNQTGHLEIKEYFKLKDLFLSSPGVKAELN